MKLSKITIKGQTTVPGEVRSALNLSPGDRISYEIRGDHAVIRRSRGVDAVAGILKGKGKRPTADYSVEREAARLAQVAGVIAKGTRQR